MSKRSGDFVTLREVVDEVGVDAVRFMMLFRKNDAPLEFDLAKVIEQSKDNPVFYVQYAPCARKIGAAARAGGLSRRRSFARGAGTGEFRAADRCRRNRSHQTCWHEYPRAGLKRRRTRMSRTGSLFTCMTSHPSCMGIGREARSATITICYEDYRDLSIARLALVLAVTVVWASGLAILGVSAPDEMR